MTPERIEEIKHMMEEEYARPNVTFSIRFLVSAPQAVADLLAALEESQQQNEALRRSLTKEACVNASNTRELAEAQQTIARQSAALGWYELGKPELARSALGNKEGSKTNG